MFAKFNKRTLLVIATVVVLAVSMFTMTSGVSFADGYATSPSGCGTCNG